MQSRIKDKIQEVAQYLEELESVLPTDFQNYKSDFKIRAICERYLKNL